MSDVRTRTTGAQSVFVSGEGGYVTYRIPAVVAAAGVLVAFAEGRRDGVADHGDIDVVARRSEDGGDTWGPLRCVCANGRGTAGNPAPVVDPASGRIALLTTYQGGGVTEREIRAGVVPEADGRRIHLQHSVDRGMTWTSPAEITAAVKRPGWRWYATGPGHGIALAAGPRPGRLVVPGNHTTASSEGAHLLLSDDGGLTWSLGAVDDHEDGVVNPNESSAAELDDGRVYVDARNEKGSAPGHRARAYSTDGGATFAAPFVPEPDLQAPLVQGAVLRLAASPDGLLLSVPEHRRARRDLVLRRSVDGGESWQPAAAVTPGPAGYSDLVGLGGGRVGVLYETGEWDYRERIDFQVVDVGA